MPATIERLLGHLARQPLVAQVDAASGGCRCRPTPRDSRARRAPRRAPARSRRPARSTPRTTARSASLEARPPSRRSRAPAARPACRGTSPCPRAFACSALQRIIPPRGPRSVLCVVVVTTSACGTGDGYTPVAASPAKCAMSTMKIAPTSFATSANAAKSITRGVRAVAGDDHLRLVLARLAAHASIVDVAVVVDAVRHGLVQQPREVHRRAVREVPALRQVHAEERVAGLQEGEEHRGVGRRAGVRLHVRVVGAEQLLRAVDRELLDLVHDLAAAVVPLARAAPRRTCS